MHGPEHPESLRTLANSADTLHQQGYFAEARGRAEQALEARNRLLGPEHPDTTISNNNLIHTLLKIAPPAALPHLKALSHLERRSLESLGATDRQILAALPSLKARAGMPE